MKKLFLTVALVASAFVGANAQQVGQWWVGGSASIWSSKDKGTDAVVSAKLIPEVGYAFSDNMAFGVSLGYAHLGAGSYLNGEKVNTNTNAYTISPFLRYSFLKGDLGSLFVDGGIGYTYAKETGIDEKINALEVGFKPGVAFNVSDRVSLIGKFGFLGYQYTKQGDWHNNSFGLQLDMSQFQMGAIVKF